MKTMKTIMTMMTLICYNNYDDDVSDDGDNGSPGVTYAGAYHRPEDGHFWAIRLVCDICCSQEKFEARVVRRQKSGQVVVFVCRQTNTAAKLNMFVDKQTERKPLHGTGSKKEDECQ